MNSNLGLKSQLSLLQSADPVVRHNAIHAIGQVKDRRAMMALKDVVLYDSDLHCRKSALFWLQRSADQVIFNEALRHALQDSSLRLVAAWNICQAGKPNPEMGEPLLHAIENEDDIAFPMIIHALGLLGDARAFNAIAVHLQSANSYHRGLAADALGHLGDRRAVELLTPLLSDTAIAWQEDHGPEISVAQIARGALQQLL